MKLKKILTLSLAINAVLLSAMGYITAQSTEPAPTPPLLRFVTNTVPVSIEMSVQPAAAETAAR